MRGLWAMYHYGDYGQLWAMYLDATTVPRVYRIKAYDGDSEIVNTTQYLLESEVDHTYKKVRERLLDLVNDDNLRIEIYPA